ncbi:MAG: type II toxin-antitoxin system RelE/ParE family toxin [Chloroflexota bacterium]
MRYSFKTKKLAALYEHEKDAHKFPAEVVDAFFAVMTRIEAARDIRDLYALKSLHFEKLKGKQKDTRSIKLNDQWRLTMRLEMDDCGNYLLILEITDYH